MLIGMVQQRERKTAREQEQEREKRCQSDFLEKVRRVRNLMDKHGGDGLGEEH